MIINLNRKNPLSKKIYHHLLGKSGSCLLIFNHGLGDLINFLPLYEELKKVLPNIKFNIGFNKDRDFSPIHSDCVSIDTNNYRYDINRKYTFVFRVDYPEPTYEEKLKGKAKPFCCMEQELGINCEWVPYTLNYKVQKESKLIGIHFTGNTNNKLKNPKFDRIRVIWEEIKELGYTPFEVHMEHAYQNNQNYPEFINEQNSLRFQKPSLKLMMNKIKECKYFIGVDSGPLYLAGSILGLENIIGLQSYFNISWYLPKKIQIIDTVFYRYETLKNIIKGMDKINLH